MTPSGFQNGLEEVLIIIEGVHAPIPDYAQCQSARAFAAPLRPIARRLPSRPPRRRNQDRCRTPIVCSNNTGSSAKRPNHVYGERGNGAPDYNFTPKTPEFPAQRPTESMNEITSKDSATRAARKIASPSSTSPRSSESAGRDSVPGLRSAHSSRYLSYLELPLLVTVYFSLMRRSPIAGVLFGAGIGLAQDSLSRSYFGMFGIVKTLVGYFAASVSQRFDVENPWCGWCWGSSLSSSTSFSIGCWRERCWARQLSFDPVADPGARRAERGGRGAAVSHLG